MTDEQLVEAAANTPPVGATTQRSTASAAGNDCRDASTPAQEGTIGPHETAADEHSAGRHRPVGLMSLLGGAWLRFRA